MQLEKVRHFIIKNRLFKNGDAIVVAVSGGPDSLCLLHLLHTLSVEFKFKLVVAHLNHCLRPEAQQEAIGVGKIASAWSLPFETKAVDIRSYKKEYGLSEEEAGRRARYCFLFDIARKYRATRIALGHHLDDQAETVLLNVLRGTGVDGLAGMLPESTRGGIKLVRPLLCLRRSEIEAYCFDNNVHPFTDSSNLETDYTRNKLRLDLIPQLEQSYNPRIREALFSLASLAADDRIFLKSLAKTIFFNIARVGRKETHLDQQLLVTLPPALRGRVLRFALKKYISVNKINRLHIDQLLDLAEKGQTGKQLTLPGSVRAYCSYGRLFLTGQLRWPEHKEIAVRPIKIPGKTLLPGGTCITARIIKTTELNWPPSSYQACIDYDLIPSGSLSYRFRWTGARFYPQGAPGSKKLKEFLIDQKVPYCRRDTLPLVTVGTEIIWVTGIRAAHPYRVTDQTRQVLLLEYKVRKRKTTAYGK